MTMLRIFPILEMRSLFININTFYYCSVKLTLNHSVSSLTSLLAFDENNVDISALFGIYFYQPGSDMQLVCTHFRVN